MATKFDGVRAEIMKTTIETFEKMGYEVLRTGSQEICLPILNEEKDEAYLKISFVIPKGERNGDPYDGYEARDAYTDKVKRDEEKKKEAARKKAEKIARDKAMREAKQRAKEQRGA